MKNTLLASVLVGITGGAALAGGPEPYIEYVDMSPEVAASWDGFYGGLVGGMQSGTITPGATSFNMTNYGGFAGYNYEHGQFVFGGEIAAQRGTITLPAAFTVDYLIDAKARVGYSLGDALLFASGGYTTTSSSAFPFQASGWNAGGGVDYAVTEKVFVGGEYVYRNMSFSNPAGFNGSSHAGQLRAGIKF